MYHTVRYVPGWFPGAGWKAKAKRFANTLTEMVDVPHQFVKHQMVSWCSCRKYPILPVIFLYPSFPPTDTNVGVMELERPQRASTTCWVLAVANPTLTFIIVGRRNGCSVIHV